MVSPTVIGWREWIRLPELGDTWVKAKIDTGARASAIHATDIDYFTKDGADWVRFVLHPKQRTSKGSVEVSAPLVEMRDVRSSNGQRQRRPLVVTRFELLGRSWPIELTLTNRAKMGFRMLIGREAMRRRFLVDPGRSYTAGRELPAGEAASWS